MRWRDEGGTVHEDCVVFCKTTDEYGDLSNMSSAFPLKVGGVRAPSSEALYQACRFPAEPDWQREILRQNSPMSAKLKAKKDGRRAHHSRPDWELVCLDVMRWALRVKLAQHFTRMAALLRSTRQRAIVELSKRDGFWGAVPEEEGLLVGRNQMGLLLMELRQHVLARPREQLQTVPPLEIPDFLLLGEPVAVVTPS